MNEENASAGGSPPRPEAVECQQCQRRLSESEERVETEGGVFCETCFQQLKDRLSAVADAQGRDINYFMAFVGGSLGGAAGALVWWGFTALTEIEFGLVAIVIGFAVSRGILYLTGGKRAFALQVMSVTLSMVAYAYGKYLVVRSFVGERQSEDGIPFMLPWLPDLELLYMAISAGAGLFDLIFVAIVVWEAWRGVSPLKVAGS